MYKKHTLRTNIICSLISLIFWGTAYSQTPNKVPSNHQLSTIITKDNISLDEYSQKELLKAYRERSKKKSLPKEKINNLEPKPPLPKSPLYKVSIEKLRNRIVDSRKGPFYINGENDLILIKNLNAKRYKDQFLSLTKADSHLIQKINKQRQSVCCIIHNNDLKRVGDEYEIQTMPLGQRYGLKSDKQLSNKPSLGNSATGFLIAPNLIATASHVMDRNGLKIASFVFGYDQDNAFPKIERSNVYTGVSIIISGKKSYGEDWCIIKLDRDVTGVEPIPIPPITPFKKNDHIYMIGHPRGMPLFVSRGLVVQKHKTSYLSSLDAFVGNSGSPIFSAKTGKLSGLFIKGKSDFYLGEFFSTENDYSNTGPTEEFIDLSNMKVSLQKINKQK